jgi:parallel beta-helix repeat protein
VIDCETSGRGFLLQSSEGPDSVIDGLTIANGLVDDVGDDDGGGICCIPNTDGTPSSPTIRNCLITGCVAGTWAGGGGIYCLGGDPTITRCTISWNAAGIGGGIYCARTDLGAPSRPTITHCVIEGNVADIRAGGMQCALVAPVINNCMIIGNVAFGESGGLELAGCEPTTVANCTISHNSVYLSGGGGVEVRYSPGNELINCILWGNTVAGGYQIRLESAVLTVSFCDVEGGELAVDWATDATLHWGAGNIDTDPLFIDPESGDYHLDRSSPCVDAGTNILFGTDIDGDPRISPPLLGTIDMGADEVDKCGTGAAGMLPVVLGATGLCALVRRRNA